MGVDVTKSVVVTGWTKIVLDAGTEDGPVLAAAPIPDRTSVGDG